MASKQGGGSTRNGRDSAGRRLGFKKFGGGYVGPGHIILRQRGTRFFAGRNVHMGRDHTLMALCEGLVFIRLLRGRQYVDVTATACEDIELQKAASV